MDVVRYDVRLKMSFERDSKALVGDKLFNIDSFLTIQYFFIEFIHLLQVLSPTAATLAPSLTLHVSFYLPHHLLPTLCFVDRILTPVKIDIAIVDVMGDLPPETAFDDTLD